MQRLRKCERKSFRFCGKWFQQDEDFGIRVTAKDNTERVQPIACDAKHGLTRKATASEVHQLRSLAWIERQTRPDLSYRISKIQSTFENACVKDVRERNRIVEYAISTSTRCRPYTLSRAHFAEDVLCEHLHILQQIFCLVMFHRPLIDVPDFSSICSTPPPQTTSLLLTGTMRTAGLLIGPLAEYNALTQGNKVIRCHPTQLRRRRSCADKRDSTDECSVSWTMRRIVGPVCPLETICVLARWVLESRWLVRKPLHFPLRLCCPLEPWSIRCKTLPLTCHPRQLLFLNLLVVSLMYQLTSLPPCCWKTNLRSSCALSFARSCGFGKCA